MKLFEIYKKQEAKIKPEVGKAYTLSSDAMWGDYAGSTVYVEKGPRGNGPSEQYRVSTGKQLYDVDWIDTWMFNDSTLLSSIPKNLIYKKPKK